jgi:hypothetical protein
MLFFQQPAPAIDGLSFADVVRIARMLAGSDEGQASRLLAAGALRYPSLAVREWASYRKLPGASGALRGAVLLVPDETVGLLRGGADLDAAAVEPVAVLANNLSMDAVVATRAAILLVAGDAEAVSHAATGSAYFKALVTRKGPLVSRAIQEFSVERMREVNAAGWGTFNAHELMMLLANGRGEETGPRFRRAYDMFLAAMRAQFANAAMLMPLRDYRIFVREAQKHGRLAAFVGKQSALFDRALDDVVSLEDSVEAAGIIEGTSDPRPLRRKLPAHVLGEYEKNLERASRLSIADLCPGGVCAQRYFFYNDADGVTSYAAFRAGYVNDGAWKFREFDGWALLSSGRVQIFANVPFDSWNTRIVMKDEEAERRQTAVTDALAARGIEPRVIVHRGHTYHVPKTLEHLTPAVKLVYLGSCRGDNEVARVLERSPDAQIISTTAVGSLRVNDPLLRELNRRVLMGNAVVEWDLLWKDMRAKLGSGSAFQQYIAPNRNSTAAILRAFSIYSRSRR